MKYWLDSIEAYSYSIIRILSAVILSFSIALLTYVVIDIEKTAQRANTLSSYEIYPINTAIEPVPVSSSTPGTVDGLTPALSTSTPPTLIPIDTMSVSSLKFITTVTDKVTSDFHVAIERIAVTGLHVNVVGLNLNKNLLLKAVSEHESEIIFAVPVRELIAGKYEIQATALRFDGVPLKVIGPRFEVIKEAVIKSGPTSTVDTLNTETTVEPVILPVLRATTTKENITPSIKLYLSTQSEYRGFVPVQIRTSAQAPKVAVYLEGAKGAAPQFAGSARYFNTGEWLLMLDTSQIPDGIYQMFAVATLRDASVESERKRFVIYNPVIREEKLVVPVPKIADKQLSETGVPHVRTTISLKPPTVVPREERTPVAVEVTSGNQNKSQIILSDELKVEIPRILKEYEKRISVYLQSYSSTVREKGIVTEADEVKVEKDIIKLILTDSRLSNISSEAKQRLEKEVARLVKHAGNIELILLKRATTQQTTEELVREIKKATVVPEDSLLDVSSPREFGLVREDLLKIESVSPVLAVDTVSTSTTVYTEIRGKALPYSFVTLFIYSSPVMVTVQADKDGTFTYVYEKDLANGDHEVYVALTTDAGAVAIKSEGFQFIREAQAFTSQTAENGDILQPITDTVPLTQNPYFIVLSLSFLALGIILLIIGVRAGKQSQAVAEV